MTQKTVFCLLVFYFFANTVTVAAEQSEKIARLGFLGFDAVASKTFTEAFRRGLIELGYVEGQNIVIEYRWAEGKPDRLPKLAAELVALKVDVIFAAAAPVIRAAKTATKNTPIVFEMLADPVSAGFVNSLAKPGGNLTGVAGLAPQLSGKRLELLKEVVPRLNSVAVLGNPANPNFRSVLDESQRAASSLKLRLQIVEVSKPALLGDAFATIVREGAEALTVFPDPMLLGEQNTIVSLAAKNRLPAVYGISGVVENGGLMTYAPSQSAMWHRAAAYVDKILKGVSPTDLPVEQPTKFELVVNLKTARQIGLTIPPNVLARADRVIR